MRDFDYAGVALFGKRGAYYSPMGDGYEVSGPWHYWMPRDLWSFSVYPIKTICNLVNKTHGDIYPAIVGTVGKDDRSFWGRILKFISLREYLESLPPLNDYDVQLVRNQALEHKIISQLVLPYVSVTTKHF